MSSGEQDHTSSVDTAEKNETPQIAEAVASDQCEQAVLDDGVKEMESRMRKKDEEIALLKDQLLRARADFDNYRKRCARDQDMNKKLAVKDFAMDVIGIHDDLIRASEAAMVLKDGDTLEHSHKAYVDGVMLISKSIDSALQKNGITEIPSLNEPFDPNHHEAIAFDTNESVGSDTVTKVFQKGFAIDKMVIRTAKVMVSKPGKKADAADKNAPAENIQ